MPHSRDDDTSARTTPSYYQIGLDVAGRRCVVVGGGTVAESRVRSLLDCGAAITVVSPHVTSELLLRARHGEIDVVRREFAPNDLLGAFLAVAATDSPEVNLAVARRARAQRCIVNVADAAGISDFIVPALVRRGPLRIAVSTSGRAPIVAKRLRHRLESEFGEEWGEYLELLGRVRELTAERLSDRDARRRLAEAAADADLLERVRQGGSPSPEEVLAELLDEGRHS